MSGFSFNPASANPAPTTGGFSFGSLVSKATPVTIATPTGLLFGTPTAITTGTLTPTGFGLPVSNAATTPLASTGFKLTAFGTPTGAATASATSSGFRLPAFGTPTGATTTNATSSGFGLPAFGTPTVATTGNATSSGFRLPAFATPTGATTANTASSGFGLPAFGTPTGATTASVTSSGFGLPAFGTPTTTTTASTGFGFPGFGTSTVATTVASGGLGFLGTTAPSATTPSLSFGSLTKPVAPGIGLGGLGNPASTTAPLAFGLSVSKTTTPAIGIPISSNSKSTKAFAGFPLGTPTVSLPASTVPNSGLNLETPSAATTTAAKSFALSLNTTKPPVMAASTAVASIGGQAEKRPSSMSTATTVVAAEPTAPVQATLTYRQLEDMVNKWTYELDEQGRNFSAELNRLNKSDSVLIANAEKISSLHAKVEACKEGQSRIEQELEFVESQQRALEDLLEPLEAAATDLPPSQQHADAEREAIFQMCINTDLELGQLLGELREMAERVNSITNDLSSSSSTANECRNPSQTVRGAGDDAKVGGNVIGQVTRILNSHMHSLNWLNQNTQELMEKMKFLAAS